jgi:hemerythrin
MARIEFPDRRTHAMIHKQLLERIQQFVQQFQQQGVLTEDLFFFSRM